MILRYEIDYYFTLFFAKLSQSFKPLIKALFYIPKKTDSIVLQLTVLEEKLPRNCMVHQYMVIFFNFQTIHQIISIHYKSRIATAIRGL